MVAPKVVDTLRSTHALVAVLKAADTARNMNDLAEAHLAVDIEKMKRDLEEAHQAADIDLPWGKVDDQPFQAVDQEEADSQTL